MSYAPAVVRLEQGSDAWLKWREEGIGASDMCAIEGVSPWLKPLELARLKLHLDPPKPPNDAIKRGIYYEPVARSIFEDQYGERMPAVCVLHPEFPELRASLDAARSDFKRIAEFKVPGQKDINLAKSKIVPPKYRPQVQFQLGITHAEVNYFGCLDPDPETGGLYVVEVEPDWTYIEGLFERARAFHSYIAKGELPPASEFDVHVRDDQDWLLSAARYRYLYSQREKIDRELADQRQQLLAMTPHMRTSGGGIAVTRYAKRGAVDRDSLENAMAAKIGELSNRLKLQPDSQLPNVESYRREGREEARITIEKGLYE